MTNKKATSPTPMEMDSDNTGNTEQQDNAKLTRLEEQQLSKDEALLEFMMMMEEYKPLIPDTVMDYYLARSGVNCDDVRIKRLLALISQKFIADIATDAFQYSKIRQQGGQSKDKRAKDKKTVLTMDDLAPALSEYGINVKKPDYYT